MQRFHETASKDFNPNATKKKMLVVWHSWYWHFKTSKIFGPGEFQSLTY